MVFCSGTYTFDQILDMASSTEIEIIQQLQLTISPDDGSSLHFTSVRIVFILTHQYLVTVLQGTTGKPKAALATHFKMINNGFLIGKRMELAGKHHTICVQVPLFHVFGTVGIIMAALNFASTIVLPTDGYQPEKSLDAVQNQKCTVITGTPTMFLDLIETQEKRKEPVSVEKALLGGAPSAPHLLEQILKTLNMSKVNVS